MQFYDVAVEQDNEPPSPSFFYTARLAHGMHLSVQCHLLTHGDSSASEMGKVTVGFTQQVLRLSSRVRAQQTGVLRPRSWFKLLRDPRPRGKDCNNLKLLKTVTFEEGQGVGKMSVKQSHMVL